MRSKPSDDQELNDEQINRLKQKVGERSNQLVHPAYAKPELSAIGPNQLWNWDITKLKGPA